MDGISLLDASVLYSLLLLPLSSILLLFLWSSANMETIAKAQLFGIILLLVLGFLAINLPIILIIEVPAIILLIVWLFTYRDFLLPGQLLVILRILALQIAFYILFFTFLGLEYYLANALLCLIPIFSMMLLYPWTFGSKNASKGRVFIIIVFMIQVIVAILTIMFLLLLTPN